MRVDLPVVFQACMQEIATLSVDHTTIKVIRDHLSSLILAENMDLDSIRDDVHHLRNRVHTLPPSEIGLTIQTIWNRWYAQEGASKNPVDKIISYKCENFEAFKKESIELDITALEQNEPLITSVDIWLKYLMKSADYRNDVTRPLLIKRVLSILEYAVLDLEFQEICENLLYLATDNCEDGGILKVNTLELEKKIRQSGNLSIEELLKLLKGAFAVTLLEEFASKFIPTLPTVHLKDLTVDPVVIHLALQIKLKFKLDLPFDCVEMNYFDASRLTQKDIDEAEFYARQSIENHEKLGAYLVTQSNWQEKLKKIFHSEISDLQAPLVLEMERLYCIKENLNSFDYNERSKKLGLLYDTSVLQWLRKKTLELLSL